MFRVFLSALLGLTLAAGSINAQPPKSKDPQKKDAPKDKAPPKDKETAKEKEKVVVKEIVGMFKSKDLTKKTLTITVDGKERTFKVTDETKIVGPRGGEAELKDDRFDKGFKITVTPNAKNADEAAEIKLPYRDDREGSDKDKAKAKDKDKPKDKDKSKDKL